MSPRALVLLGLASLAACEAPDGGVANSHPVHLTRPDSKPLSAAALVGRQIFFDTTLSASGHVACAGCHRAEYAYAAPHDDTARARAVPTLRYAYRAPNFSIGPDDAETENVNVAQMAAQAVGSSRPRKLVGAASSATTMVPQGGLFWDGRVNTLQDQAMGPLFNAAEMANRSTAAVAAKLRKAAYAPQLTQLFGAEVMQAPSRLVDEAMFAVARYEIEDASFHPYTSKYDYYLEGKARLTPAEARGLRAFDDTTRGNCAGCHLDQPRHDGLPPAFTDYQYEALGVPRNDNIPADRDQRYFDLGVCGPVRTDLTDQTQFCGMFRTPTLRNVATRATFFHNGKYRTLDQVLAFYAFRDTQPDSVYPAGPDGHPRIFDDVPGRFRANIDVIDPPFNRKMGQAPPMTVQERRDLVAFLQTLTDGYQQR